MRSEVKPVVLFRPSYLWAVIGVGLSGIIGAASLFVLAQNRITFPVALLPAVNASLNAGSALLLCIGYFFIRRRMITAHWTCMLAAFGLSALFLLSYLVYHFQAGSKAFPGQGWIRPVYYAILISHVLFAATIVPMAVIVVRRGFSRQDRKHRWLARRALPLWLYTSVTGVIIYLLLYQLF